MTTMPVTVPATTTEVQVDVRTVAVAVIDPAAVPVAIAPPAATMVHLLHGRCGSAGLDAVHSAERGCGCRGGEEGEREREGASGDPFHLCISFVEARA